MIAAGALPQRVARRARRFTGTVRTNVRFLNRRVRSTSEKRYRRAIARAACVSLDVFDTALFRCVPHPTDVFEIVGLRLREAGAKLDPISFRQVRIESESEARRWARADAGLEEVTLSEIYAELARRMPDLDVARAMEVELEVERAVLVANPDCKALYDSLQAEERRIVFVSDTYFPEAFVSEVLQACGFTGDHTVIASSTHRATKEHGTLWPVIAKRLGVALDAFVHMGDNVQADVRSALAAGVSAFWYKRRLPVRHAPDALLADKVLDRMSALFTDAAGGSEEDRLLQKISYDVAAPIFLGLGQWLVDSIRAAETDLVLFCARDGMFLQKTFARFAEHVALPPARYFEVSRRALVIPSIVRLDARTLDMLCANNAPLETAQFFDRIGIDVRAYPAELAAAGLDADSRIYDADSRRRLRALFEALEAAVLERAASERALMLAYLDESGVLDARDVSVVDIGWGGTLQQALADVLKTEGKSASIRGYYLSTDDRICSLDAHAGPAQAWFANAAQPAWMQRVISPGYWLLEIAFAAQHGTVLGYRREPGGCVEPVHHHYDPEAPNARAARAIHAASAAYIDRWIRVFGGVGPLLPRASAFARFRRFVEHPTLAEARFFGNMVHVGGLGTTTETLAIAAPPSIGEVMRRPRSMLDAYRESHWQLAFLQRVTRSNALAAALLSVREGVRLARTQLRCWLARVRLSSSAHS